jgi:hypothetical protein
MRRLGVLSVLMALLACERADGARDSEARISEAARSPAPAPTSPTKAESPEASGRCVVPTSDEPLREAKPAERCPPDPDGPLDLHRGYVTFEDAPGQPRIAVELARTTKAQTRGLMYRTKLEPDSGMLFSWSFDQVHSFWMRNTCIPLDMLFVHVDGTIAGILEQVPTLNEEPRSVPCAVRHVLEVNAGFCRSHGIKAGQRIRIEP